MAMAVPVAGLNKQASIFNPLQKKAVLGSFQKRSNRLQVKASMKEKAVAAATSAAVVASMVIPQVSEAAELAPSLKNFLLSIVSGGVVLVAIVGAVIGVSYFDPVKRT